MSANIRVVPKEKRLRITAKFEHKTVRYDGNIFEFIEHLMKERVTGVATCRLNLGQVYGMEFDLRETVPTDSD